MINHHSETEVVSAIDRNSAGLIFVKVQSFQQRIVGNAVNPTLAGLSLAQLADSGCVNGTAASQSLTLLLNCRGKGCSRCDIQDRCKVVFTKCCRGLCEAGEKEPLVVIQTLQPCHQACLNMDMLGPPTCPTCHSEAGDSANMSHLKRVSPPNASWDPIC